MTEYPGKNSREELFAGAEKKLQYPPQIYPLGKRFEDLTPELAEVWVLDVTQIPGCHYGLKNVFVPIIKNLEEKGVKVEDRIVDVTPDTAILIEPSTGNAWVAFSNAANFLGYEHRVIMPAGLPEARYRHPQGREVNIIRTPAEDYALGMPRELKKLIKKNPQRLAGGEKIYVTPNHAVGAAETTIKTMSEMGRQLLNNIGNNPLPLKVIVSMGNGASLCALGEYVIEHKPGSQVVVTESFAYGGGYNQFASLKGFPSYRELYGIDPGNSQLMKVFSAYGTYAPIGIPLPLQERAFAGNLIYEYILFTDTEVMRNYVKLQPSAKYLKRVKQLLNYSALPEKLINTFGNSSLANIITASQFTQKGELVVAMVYDGRKNY